MPSGRVVEPGEVYLNGRYYKLIGQVRRSLVSQLPPKVTIGEYNEASNPIASSITWSDLTGGMGQEVMKAGDPPNKVFAADAATWFPGFVSLNANVATNALTTFTGLDVRDMLRVNDTTIMAVSSSRVGGNLTTPAVMQTGFSPSVRPLTATPIHLATGQIGTQAYVVCPVGPDMDYTTNASTSAWSRNTTDISYAAFWRDLLWGISTNGGGLYFTADPSGAWTQVTALVDTNTAFDTAVYGLFTGPAADGTEALYILALTGLYVYDPENERIMPTILRRSLMPVEGRIPVHVWRGTIFVVSRQIIYAYTPGPSPILRVLTPFPNGIPSEYDAPFRDLNSNFAALWLLAAGTAVSSALKTIYAYDNEAWRIVTAQVHATSGINNSVHKLFYVPAAVAGEVNDILFAVGFSTGVTNARILSVLTDIQRPKALSGPDYTYNSSGLIILPWVQREGNQDWLALEALVNVTIPGTSENVSLDYALNFSSSWTSMGTNSTTGEKTFQFPVTGDQVGTAFNAIRLRAGLHSGVGGLTSKSPLLHRVALSYLRKPRTLWGFDVVLDLTNPKGYKGYSPKQQREAIETAITTTPLVEFTYRDEADNTENHFVQVLAPESLEDAGRHERNTYRLRLTEAI